MIVTVQGAQLYCSVRGTGPCCLVLTAIGTKPYERMMRAPLTDRLTLVCTDLRGGGQSTGSAADLTFDLLARDLEAVRLALGAPRVAVLGHSILGVLAIEYGRRCPGTVSHVIAVGTPPHADMTRLAAEGARYFEETASPARKEALRVNVAGLPTKPSPGQVVLAQTPMRFFDERFDAAPLFAEAEVRPELMSHLMGELMRGWDVARDIETLRVPMLVALGRADCTVPPPLWQDVASKVPNATLEVFERSGHQPFFEEPDRFAEVVTRWMAGSSGRSPNQRASSGV